MFYPYFGVSVVEPASSGQHLRDGTGFRVFQLIPGCFFATERPGCLCPSLIRHCLRRLNSIFTTNRLLAALLSFLTVSGVSAQPALDVVTGRVRTENAVFALYGPHDFKPIAIIHLDKAFTDYERKGFFKIGSLPVGVLEGLTLELGQTESVTNGLAELHRWLKPQASAKLELHKVTFLIPTTPTNRLEIARVHIVPGGKLELVDGITFISGCNKVTAPRGTLQILGADAGQVILEGSRRWTNNLLAHFSSDNLVNQKEIK